MGANIFERYGVKEVANVYFQALADDEKAGVKKDDIVLFLDTLKVSTIETTAESTEARGGWGNPKLVMWDYGKEINITLEDALISMESLRFMLGGAVKKAGGSDKVTIHYSEQASVQTENTLPTFKDHITGEVVTPVAPYHYINMTSGARGSVKSDEGITAAVGDVIRVFWEEQKDGTSGNEAVEITISPNTFPGTYRVVGDTFIRSEATGKDEAFQFVIEKAKVLSNVTITLQAEGDPSTFEMSLNVLRATNAAGENEMMKLIKY